jgi:hypothetical protein
VAVLGLVDILGVCSKDLSFAILLQAESDVLRQLATNTDDYAVGIFELILRTSLALSRYAR